VDWAIAIVGRNDPGSVLMLFAERSEAEAIASQMRGHGRRAICVRPFYSARRESQQAQPAQRSNVEARSPQGSG
jgi:hypothetical protein